MHSCSISFDGLSINCQTGGNAVRARRTYPGPPMSPACCAKAPRASPPTPSTANPLPMAGWACSCAACRASKRSIPATTRRIKTRLISFHDDFASDSVLTQRSFCPRQSLVSTGRSLVSTGRSLVSTRRSVVLTGRSVVSTGRSVVSTGRSVVSTGRSLVSTGRSVVLTRRSVVSTGRSVVSTGRSLVSTGQSVAQMARRLIWIVSSSAPLGPCHSERSGRAARKRREESQ